MEGKVLTVLGPVSPQDLGIVLPHEHLFLDFKQAYNHKAVPDYVSDNIDSLPLTIGNLGLIRQYPYSNRENLAVESEEEIIKELKHYKSAGGGTLCDVTVIGIRTKPEALPKVSTASGVHIILGTGYYVECFIPENIKQMDLDSIASTMVDEIQNGVSGVRCGIIGEIGCSWPLTTYEIKVLQAAAIAQTKTGAPLIIHPGRGEDAPFQIVDVLKNAGADLSHTIMSHIDRTIFSTDKLLKFAQLGCGIEYDLFGIETSHYQFNADVDMPSDAQRIQMVKFLIENGYKDRLFLSHDIHTKHRMVKYGGHGFAHLLKNVVPKMVDRGIPHDVINQMMVTNPKKWLTFV